MIFQDDRPPEQKGWLIVLMTDRYLSGWGKAENGPCYAGWPFPDGEQSRVEQWVRSRTGAMRVRIVLPSYRPPSGPGHCHIHAYRGQGKVAGYRPPSEPEYYRNIYAFRGQRRAE